MSKMYWTKEKCINVAKKSKSRSFFKKKYNGAWYFCKRNGFLDDINKILPKDGRRKWTKEICGKIALKYNYRSDFEKNDVKAYRASQSNGWLDEICLHMNYKTKPKGYWTKEKCKKEALKYDTKKDWINNSNVSYLKALENLDFYNECTQHMKILGSKNKRLVYVFFFKKTNSIYIGITSNNERRKKNHLCDNKSPVYRHMINNNESPEYYEISDYIDFKEAVSLEIKLILIYDNSKLNLLNKTNGGELGSSKLFWTKQRCRSEVLNYSSRSEFKKNAGGGYKSALLNGWLDEICLHMKYLQLPNGYWSNNKIRCFNEGIKYKNINQFKLNSSGAYNAIVKNRWYGEFKQYKKLKEP